MIDAYHPHLGARVLQVLGLKSERTLTIPLSMDVRVPRRSAPRRAYVGPVSATLGGCR
jgi:hypothetical protein